jgi:predicted signal transduction protein with EAL and GGDEF domain
MPKPAQMDRDHAGDPLRANSMLAPFACTAALAWIAVIVGTRIDWVQYALAALLLTISGLLAVVLPRRVSSAGLGRVAAQDVIDRLRGAVSQGRTCSAGFAVRRPAETAEALMARADVALYEAKASGRDRACMSA